MYVCFGDTAPTTSRVPVGADTHSGPRQRTAVPDSPSSPATAHDPITSAKAELLSGCCLLDRDPRPEYVYGRRGGQPASLLCDALLPA